MVNRQRKIFLKEGKIKMANLDKLFNVFLKEIAISNTKKENLKISRNSIRQDIKTWFSDNDKRKPSFCCQGSYAMKTLINPINDNDYDIDDGAYINGYEKEDVFKWPSPSTIHKWIKDAVEERTSTGTVDKDTCIRVNYSKGYHVDIPMYICKDGKAYLAHKSKGWTVSDPQNFTKWFLNKVEDDDKYGEQLRRIVMYLKAWRDYKENPLKGIEITILATNSFEKYEGRDDKSLKHTIDNIVCKIEKDFHCYKPVEPWEDLFEDASDTRKDLIISGLKNCSNNLENALKEVNEKTASEILRSKVFGTRFPLGTEKDEYGYAISKAPGILKSDGRSA